MSGRGGRKGTKSEHSSKGGTQSESTQKDVSKDPDMNCKTKVQPTAEQLRLAQMINVNSKTEDRVIQDKIEKVMELTGKSPDEAMIALHDCDYDANRAIDVLLEGDGQGEWETSCKKKRSKPIGSKSDMNKDGTGDRNYDKDKPDGMEGGMRERSHSRGIPRLQKRGGSNENRGWRNRENKENEKNLEDSGSSYRSRGGRMSSGPGRGGRDRGRGSGRGPRMFQNKSQSRRGHSSHGGVIPNPIETWNNSQVDSNVTGSDNITVGTWDNFPAAEDWDNEEWTGSLSDTKVFTRSHDQSGDANTNHIQVPNDSTTNQVSAISHSPIPAMSTSNTQVNHLQSLLHKPSMMQNSQPTLGSVGSSIGNNLSTSNGLNQMTPSQPFLSPFSQQTSDTIKSGVSVSPTSSFPNTNNSNSSCQFSNFSSSSSSNCTSNFNNEQLVSYNKSGTSQTQAPIPVRPKQTRPKLPPSSKIPSAPVEMPDDAISKLDVQFGELEFGKESPNFDFTYNASESGVNVNGNSGTKTIESYNSVSTQVSSASNEMSSKPQVGASSYPGGQSTASFQPTNTSYATNPSFPSQSYTASQTSSYTNTPNSYVNNSTGSGTTGYSSNSATYQTNVTTYTQSQSNSAYQSVSQPNSSYQAQSVPNYGSSNTYSGTSAGSQYQASYGNTASVASTPSTLANMSNAKLSAGLSNAVKDTQYDGSSTNPVNLSTTLPSNGNNTNVALGLSSVNTVSTGSGKGSVSSNGTYDGKVNNMPSIPPGVPMLNTQYILGQAAGMPPFYTASLQPPVYYDDISLLQQRLPHMAPSYYELAGFQAQTSLATGSANIATGTPGRDANMAGVTVPFSVAAESSSKFRNDTSSSSPVQTTLSQQGAVTQQQTYISPPAAAALPQYAYYISGGVMPGSFSQYPAPQAIFPMYGTSPSGTTDVTAVWAGDTYHTTQIPPATNAHNIATTQFQKLGSGSGYNYGNSNFDSLSGHSQDFSKSYGANNPNPKQSGVNNASGGNPASDLSASYAKAHASLGKVNSYDKQGFHGATPPPYNFAGTGATTLGPNFGPHVFIPALHAPHSQMITHQLHQDAGPGGNQRSQTGGQGNKGAAKQNYNTNYWTTN